MKPLSELGEDDNDKIPFLVSVTSMAMLSNKHLPDDVSITRPDTLLSILNALEARLREGRAPACSLKIVQL